MISEQVGVANWVWLSTNREEIYLWYGFGRGVPKYVLRKRKDVKHANRKQYGVSDMQWF